MPSILRKLEQVFVGALALGTNWSTSTRNMQLVHMPELVLTLILRRPQALLRVSVLVLELGLVGARAHISARTRTGTITSTNTSKKYED